MNKLTRSKKNRVFLGVCGGIGEYFNIDSTIIRLIFVFLVFVSFGIAVFGYIVSGLIIPEKDVLDQSSEYEDAETYNERNEKLRKNTPIFIGIGLILWGAYLLTEMILPGIFYRLRYIWNYWPILLILLGLYVIFQKRD